MTTRIEPTLTREHVAQHYNCSHTELGRLLRARIAPLPVRLEGAVLWYEDEVKNPEKTKSIVEMLERLRHRSKAA